ncbi:hypothetical protein JCM10207_007630 [Rhodosporidiobolus poonsookiae]
MDLPTPKTDIPFGEKIPFESASSSSIYQIEHFDDNAYSCTCPSWTFQKSKIDVRSCKHLREILGDEHEDARTGDSGKSKSKGKSKPKKKKDEDDENRTYAEEGSKKRPVAAIGAKATGSKAKKRKVAQKEEEESEESDEDGFGGAKGVSDPDEDGPAKGASKKKSAAVKSKKAEPEKADVHVLLANKWDLDGKKDPKGYWISEKLDGVRAYWDGQGGLFSRLGNPFAPPEDFIAKLPRGVTLDGELFLGRDRFDETSGIARRLNAGDKWNEMRFMVFDIPSMADDPFETRLAALNKLFPTAPSHTATAPSAASVAPAGPDVVDKQGEGTVRVVEQEKCEGKEHLLRRLEEVKKLGGEGLMLREPASRYIPKRSSTLLKVKTFHDAEARVVGHEPGKGKYKDMCGALVCEMEKGTRFSVGSGLTDARRETPPEIGAIITYRFQDLTKAGVPRFPTFVGERHDTAGPKDAVIPKVGGADADE